MKLMYMLSLLFALTFLVFFSMGKKFLYSLLVLESLVLVSLLVNLLALGTVLNSMYLFILLLTLAVSEAAMGLSLLMSYLKMNGSDLILANLGIS
uniref:NADH dehydrogenase subunit 4L n=1 Tax=Megalophaedusa kawamotoi TaxID=1885868 RepID=A0A224A1K2_9EUPU|nr:NADH dehydrogenase subunit 4L [Megalophaedusa kawamotoi]